MRYLVAVMLVFAVALPGHGQPIDRVDEFIARLDTRAPELLLRDVVPSLAVAVVHDGRIVTRTWGLADVASARIATNGTRYNIASISKLLTAWGVMRLVEDGKVRTMLVRIPDRGVTVIVLSSSGEAKVEALAAAIADRLIAKK